MNVKLCLTLGQVQASTGELGRVSPSPSLGSRGGARCRCQSFQCSEVGVTLKMCMKCPGFMRAGRVTAKKMRFDPATQNYGLGCLFFPSLLSAFHGVCFIPRFSLHVSLASVTDTACIFHSFLAQEKEGQYFPFPSIPIKGPGSLSD